MATKTLQNITSIQARTQRFKLTELAIENLKPRAKIYNVWDSEVKNLHVRVQVSGSKAYYVKKNKKTRKLGDVGVITVAQARQEATQALAEGVEASRHVGKSLSSAFHEYMQSREFSSGFESNVNQCKRVFSKLLEKPVTAITKIEIVNAIEKAKKASGQPYSDSTIDSILNVLSSVFTYQIALDAIEDNPCKNLKKRLPKLNINKRSHKLMDSSELAEFVKWFRQYDGVSVQNLPTGVSIKNVSEFQLIGLLGSFLLMTGCRISEALKLKKEDVVKDVKRAVNGKLIPYSLTFRDTKNGSDLTLYMPAHLYGVVVQSIEKTGDSPYVFRFKDVNEGAMYGRFERSLSKVVVRGVGLNPHDLRRTAAYLMAMAGIAEPDIGIILNHNTGSMTHRYIGDQSIKSMKILSKYHEFLDGKIYYLEEELKASGLAVFSKSSKYPVNWSVVEEDDGGLDEYEVEEYYKLDS